MTKIKKENYNLSDNYPELWRKAQYEVVLALVSKEGFENIITKVEYLTGGSEPVMRFKFVKDIWVVCKTKEDFIACCELYNLSYIVPENRAQMREKLSDILEYCLNGCINQLVAFDETGCFKPAKCTDEEEGDCAKHVSDTIKNIIEEVGL